MLYLILKHAHSGIRWIALLLLIGVIVNSLMKRKKNYSRSDRKAAFFSLVLLHIQLAIGMVLYFVSPKVVFSAESMANRMLRFFLVEHILLMLIAIVLATIGVSASKKVDKDSKKHNRIILYFGIALILILAAIPWPWQNLSSGWV